jgi:hypothetical protein
VTNGASSDEIRGNLSGLDAKTGITDLILAAGCSIKHQIKHQIEEKKP